MYFRPSPTSVSKVQNMSYHFIIFRTTHTPLPPIRRKYRPTSLPSPPPPLPPFHLIHSHNPPPNTLRPRRHLLHRRLPKAANPKIPLPKAHQLPLLTTPDRPRRHRRRRHHRHRRRHPCKMHRLRHRVRKCRQRRPRRRLFFRFRRRARLSHALRLDRARVVLDEDGGLVLGRDVGAVVGRLVGGLAGGLEDAAVDARVGDVQDDAVAGRAGGAVRSGGDVGDEDVGEGVDLGLGGGAAADGDGGAGPGEAKQLEGRGGEGSGRVGWWWSYMYLWCLLVRGIMW